MTHSHQCVDFDPFACLDTRFASKAGRLADYYLQLGAYARSKGCMKIAEEAEAAAARWAALADQRTAHGIA
jgi:hypothetical protein